MKQLTILTAAVWLAACTTPPAPTQTAGPAVLQKPVQLIQYERQGFAFCTKNCPVASQKVTFMSVDLSADDPKQRILARLRNQMARQTGTAGRTEQPGVVEVAKSDPSAKATEAWTIYALHGSADQPATAAALRKIVEAAPGARFHFIATEGAAAEMQAYKSALTTMGVAQRAMGAYVLQAPLRTDVQLAGQGSTSPSDDKKMLVIRKRGEE